jgi:DNA-binding beta-propeller fold protein YncE
LNEAAPATLSWSEDGTYLAVEAEYNDGSTRLTVLNWATGSETRIDEATPGWHFVGNDLVGPGDWISASRLTMRSLTPAIRRRQPVTGDIISYGNGYSADWFLTSSGLYLISSAGVTTFVAVGNDLTKLPTPYTTQMTVDGAMSRDGHTLVLGIADQSRGQVVLIDCRTGRTTGVIPIPVVPGSVLSETYPYYDESGELFVTNVSRGKWSVSQLTNGKLEAFSAGSTTAYTSPDRKAAVNLIALPGESGQPGTLTEQIIVDGRMMLSDSGPGIPLWLAVSGVTGSKPWI